MNHFSNRSTLSPYLINQNYYETDCGKNKKTAHFMMPTARTKAETQSGKGFQHKKPNDFQRIFGLKNSCKKLHAIVPEHADSCKKEGNPYCRIPFFHFKDLIFTPTSG
ncbi:hypothetical protein ESA94_03080 [Lacibacter luteus]|uniref:Uncharacterized protein n=1 Tax=Lacibacter luteus TaxID=2508719 RepID=A0A4Q1CMJ5_9BACT|nr:hypothetical protein [Lacibacter luteus]RXK62014.1 hypothetical protein ESA94_03080 [Lacibacter luteus]